MKKTNAETKFKENGGITLIALVITIIILLILAGISIGMLSGDNGILGQAGNAKTQTDIAGEKEILEQATILAMGKSKYGDIDKDKLDAELNKYSGINNTQETDEGIEVTFSSGRTYLVDSDGNVNELIIVDRTGIEIGDYITYTSPTESVNLDTDETGYSDTQTLPRKNTFKVMQINKNGSMILLGAMTSSDTKIYFKGAKGYNNIVYTLNKKCNDLYKDEANGITARSIKVEDITDLFNDDGNSKLTDYMDSQINALKKEYNIDKENRTVTYKTTINYPDIFKYEANGKIDDSDTTGEVEQSDTYAGYNGITTLSSSVATSRLTLPYTDYNTSHSISDFSDSNNASAYQNLFFGTGCNYWLASRCIGYSSDAVKQAWFGIRYVSGKAQLSSNLVYFASGTSRSQKNAVCPIVYLPSSININISKTASSSSGTPHMVVLSK